MPRGADRGHAHDNNEDDKIRPRDNVQLDLEKDHLTLADVRRFVETATAAGAEEDRLVGYLDGSESDIDSAMLRVWA